MVVMSMYVLVMNKMKPTNSLTVLSSGQCRSCYPQSEHTTLSQTYVDMWPIRKNLVSSIIYLVMKVKFSGYGF